MPGTANWPGRLAIAPFAIPVLVCAPIWTGNANRLAFGYVLPSVAVLYGLVALLFVAVRLVTRSWTRAALISTIWLAYLLYLPSLLSMITDRQWIIWLALIGGAGLAFDLARRVPKDTDALARANRTVNLLMWVPALLLAGVVASNQLARTSERPDPRQSFAAFEGKANESSPDVWHIVMDRYANSETMLGTYGFDNSQFLNALRKRGFAVSENAHSNYQMTAHSLTSTLNASYLDGYAKNIRTSKDLIPLFEATDRNAAMRFFRDQGYETIFSGTWANITNASSIAERDINYRALSEFPRILIDQSVPGVIGKALGLPFTNGRADQCARAKYKFAKLNDIAKEPHRKFVFAHFLVPHPPFAINADGSCNPLEIAKTKSRAENFVGQVRYGNRELLSLIDSILAGPRPATIILHADEGPYPAHLATDEPTHTAKPVSDMDWVAQGEAVWREKSGILMAIRHADGETQTAPETPVNLYPLILNRSFGANLPLKEDKVYFFRNDLDFYTFHDVTSAVR